MSASFELDVGALRNEIEALKRKQEFWREEAEMQRLSEQIYTSRAKQRLRLLDLYMQKFNEDHPPPAPARAGCASDHLKHS
jgi:hypothetical protein